MAFYRGEEGSVKFKNAAGTTAAIASTTNWNLSLTKDTLDCTAQGATSRSYVGSLERDLLSFCTQHLAETKLTNC